jgi:hypothetical protein
MPDSIDISEQIFFYRKKNMYVVKKKIKKKEKEMFLILFFFLFVTNRKKRIGYINRLYIIGQKNIGESVNKQIFRCFKD